MHFTRKSTSTSWPSIGTSRIQFSSFPQDDVSYLSS